MAAAARRTVQRQDRVLQGVLRGGRPVGPRRVRHQGEHHRIRDGRAGQVDRVQDLGAGRHIGGRRAQVASDQSAHARGWYVFTSFSANCRSASWRLTVQTPRNTH